MKISCGVFLGALTLLAAPAQAITFTGSSVTLGALDVGAVFTVNFDGNVATQNVSGLTSSATFTLLTYNSTLDFVEFEMALQNTSSGGVTSRTSALGFNTNPDVTSGSTVAGGLFEYVRTGGSFPNQFGAIELCLTDGNNCQGGGNGGVSTGDAAASTTFRLNFSDLQASLVLDNFGVRYQSINGTTLGSSGTGVGTPDDPLDPPPPAPEPATMTLVGLGLLGAGIARRRKQ